MSPVRAVLPPTTLPRHQPTGTRSQNMHGKVWGGLEGVLRGVEGGLRGVEGGGFERGLRGV